MPQQESVSPRYGTGPQQDDSTSLQFLRENDPESSYAPPANSQPGQKRTTAEAKPGKGESTTRPDEGFTLLRGENAESVIFSTKGAGWAMPEYDILLSNKRILFARRQAILGFIHQSLKTSISYKEAEADAARLAEFKRFFYVNYHVDLGAMLCYLMACTDKTHHTLSHGGLVAWCRDICWVTIGHVHNTRLLHVSVAFILFALLLLFVCFTVTQYVVMGIFLVIGLGCMSTYLANMLVGRGLDIRIDTFKRNAAVGSWHNRVHRQHASMTFTARLPAEHAYTVMNFILAHEDCPILQSGHASPPYGNNAPWSAC